MSETPKKPAGRCKFLSDALALVCLVLICVTLYFAG